MDLFVLKIDVFTGRACDATEVAEDQSDGADIGAGFPMWGEEAEDGAGGIIEDGGYIDVAEETLGACGSEVADFENGAGKVFFGDGFVVRFCCWQTRGETRSKIWPACLTTRRGTLRDLSSLPREFSQWVQAGWHPNAMFNTAWVSRKLLTTSFRL